MNLSKSNILDWIKKSYLFVAIILFAIWMIFFDENSYLAHQELDEKIEHIQLKKEYYQKEYKKDSLESRKLNTSQYIEEYARKNLKMKKPNEELFLVKMDSTN